MQCAFLVACINAAVDLVMFVVSMRLNVLGLNCGTSVDAVDVALVHIESEGENMTLHLAHYSEHPVPPSLRARLLCLCRPEGPTTLAEVCDLNVEIGEVFASAVLSSGAELRAVDLIASHGQTLWHHPIATGDGGWADGGRRAATMQMGESTIIQQRTGITVASDFRSAEIAAGRQGAPLSGILDSALLRGKTLRVAQNIGGMANASVVPPCGGYFAFDKGPGNVLIDSAVRYLTEGKEECDLDGRRALAGAGEVDHCFVEEWLAACDYLHQTPPKTTGRELFSDATGVDLTKQLLCRGLSADGVVATITRLTAESISRSLCTFVEHDYGPIGELLVSGGGARNPVLMQHLRDSFPHSIVRTSDDAASGVQLPAEAKEAVLFALLGFLCVTGRTAPVSALEPSKTPTIMGKITPGQNFLPLMRKATQCGSGVLGKVTVV